MFSWVTCATTELSEQTAPSPTSCVVCHPVGAPAVASMIASWVRGRPPTVVKLPPITSVLPSGVTSRVSTAADGKVGLIVPVTGTLKVLSAAPVLAFRTASAPRVVPPSTLSNRPPTNNLGPRTTTALTRELAPSTVPANAGTRAPVRSSSARSCSETVSTVLNDPPTMTLDPFASSASTGPSSVGENAGSSRPVLALKAAR